MSSSSTSQPTLRPTLHPTTTTTSSSSSSTHRYYPSTSSSSTTPTPSAPTPAPSRNPSLFPGSDTHPAPWSSSPSSRAHQPPQPPDSLHNNADYINALAAAAQASLQSAPSSPGADLPISRGSGGGSGSGGPGGKRASAFVSPDGAAAAAVREASRERVVEEDGARGAGEEGCGEGAGGARGPMAGGRSATSFLDIDESTPVTTPGSAAVDEAEELERRYPLGREDGEEEEEEEEEEEGEQGVEGNGYGSFTDPLARARAGVSVAKGEGFVERASVMLDRGVAAGSRQQTPRHHGRQQSWNEQDMRHEMTARFWKGGPVQGYDSTGDGKGLN